MKIKEGFILRKMPGMNLVMPVGANRKNYRKTVVLNDTAARIFELLQAGASEEEAAQKFVEEYSIDLETATSAVQKTFADLKEAELTID